MTKQREVVTGKQAWEISPIFRPNQNFIFFTFKVVQNSFLNVYYFSSEKIEIFTGQNLDNFFRTSKIILRCACKSLQYYSMHMEKMSKITSSISFCNLNFKSFWHYFFRKLEAQKVEVLKPWKEFNINSMNLSVLAPNSKILSTPVSDSLLNIK